MLRKTKRSARLLLWGIFSVVCLVAFRLQAQTPTEETPFISGGFSWSPDGEMIAIGASDGIWLHETDTLSVIRQLGKQQFVSVLDWSPDGSRIASGGSGGLIQVWDVADSAIVYSLQEQTNPITSLQWGPDGSALASSSWYEFIPIWDAETGQVLHLIKAKTAAEVSVSWSPYSSQLVAKTYQVMSVWDTNTGRLDFAWVYDRESSAIKWSPDGFVIATADNGVVKLWEPWSGELKKTFDAGQDFRHVKTLAWSPDSKYVAAQIAKADDVRIGQVFIWDVTTDELVVELPNVIMTGDGHYANALAWSPDGSKLASISDDGHVYIWDAESFETLAAYDGYKSIVLSD